MKRRFPASAAVRLLSMAAVAALGGCATARPLPRPPGSPSPEVSAPGGETIEASFAPDAEAAPARAGRVALAEYLPGSEGRWTFAQPSKGGAERRGGCCARWRAKARSETWIMERSPDGSRAVARREAPGATERLALEPGTGGILAATRGGKRTDIFQPALPLFPQALVFGEEWSAESRMLTVRPGALPAEGMARRTARLVAVEPVKVAAGEFDRCLKIETATEATIAGAKPVVVRETVWLARGVGVVRRERPGEKGGARALELVKAKIGERALPAREVASTSRRPVF